MSEGGHGRCVLAGHSWGGLLARLVAIEHPELIAGLVLIDPADEDYWAALPARDHNDNTALGDLVLRQHASGELPVTIRDTFGPFAQRLTSNPQLQALILDAYVSCYVKPPQARIIQDENRLFSASVPLIRQIPAAGTLPDVPVMVFSAITGTPADQRKKWTSLHADLAAAAPGGRHIVLADTDHAINQERPGEIAQAINRIIGKLRRDNTPPAPAH